MRDRDSQTGEYNETYPLEKFVNALEELDGEVGTKDVQHVVGCEYRTALAKLKELEENGTVTSRRVGNAYLWSLAENTGMENPRPNQELSKDQSPQEEDPMGGDIYDPLKEFE